MDKTSAGKVEAYYIYRISDGYVLSNDAEFVEHLTQAKLFGDLNDARNNVTDQCHIGRLFLEVDGFFFNNIGL